jgi:GNAT superfamily N-acetyltransferase
MRSTRWPGGPDLSMRDAAASIPPSAPSSEPACRRATLADLSELRALERAAFTQIGSRFYPLADIEVALDTLEGLTAALIEQGRYFVLQQGAGPILASGGWSRAVPDYQARYASCAQAPGRTGGEATVRCVYVRPDHERRGFASRIVRWVEADARSHGIHTLRLSSSRTALSLYRALGYSEVADHAIQLHNGRSIALTEMRKALVPDAAPLPTTALSGEEPSPC